MFCRPSCSSVAGFSHGHVVSNENLFQHDQFFFIIFGLIFFKIFQVEFFSFYIVIGCTNTPLFFSISFLSFDYLLILSYVSLLTLCRGWNTTHTFSKIQFKKKNAQKKDSEPELEDHVEDVDARRKKGKKKVAYFSPS